MNLETLFEKMKKQMMVINIPYSDYPIGIRNQLNAIEDEFHNDIMGNFDPFEPQLEVSKPLEPAECRSVLMDDNSGVKETEPENDEWFSELFDYRKCEA